jgi:hypothetical protein
VVPITIDASGVENTVGGSLTFDPTVLTYSSAALGPNATGAALNLNTTQTSTGSLGFGLALPSGTTLAAGTDQILTLTFSIASGTTQTSTAIGWSSTPVAEEVVDASANNLSATFTGGTVTLGAWYEGDVLNHGKVDLSDWVKVGRYAVGLDPQPTSMAYECADCAPRSTLGSGKPIDLADWVETGRYAVGLDPITPAGGPSAATSQP